MVCSTNGKQELLLLSLRPVFENAKCLQWEICLWEAVRFMLIFLSSLRSHWHQVQHLIQISCLPVLSHSTSKFWSQVTDTWFHTEWFLVRLVKLHSSGGWTEWICFFDYMSLYLYIHDTEISNFEMEPWKISIFDTIFIPQRKLTQWSDPWMY